MAVTLGELAVRFGCELRGDPDLRVASVATLQTAAAGSIAFLANPKYRGQLSATRAAAVILERKFAQDCPVAALISPNPYATYARVAGLLHPEPVPQPGVHRSASVDSSATVAASAAVGAGAVIEDGVKIGERVSIGPGCVLLQGVEIGDDTRLVANVTLCRGVRIGMRAILHPGVVVGSDGFGFAAERGAWIKVPQTGGVRIGDDVEIGANTTIDRGAIEDTVIEEGVKLDNQIQIGHNVTIGAHTAIAGCTGISGSTSIGQRCMIAGMVGIAGHLTLCDDVLVTGRTFVNHSIRTPGIYSGGLPMDEARRWRRNSARFKHLDELAKRLDALDGKTSRTAAAKGEGAKEEDAKREDEDEHN